MTKEVVPEVIAEQVCSLVGGDAEAQCRVATTSYGLTRFANSFIHQHHGEETTTVTLRLGVDGRVATVSTTRTDGDALGDLVEDARTAAQLQPRDPYWPGVGSDTQPATDGHAHPSTINATPDDRADHVARFVAAAPTMSAAGFVDTAHVRAAVATTAGLRRSGVSTRATLDAIHRSERLAGNAHQTHVRFSSIDGAACGGRSARLAGWPGVPIDIDIGEYEVVLAPECVATIAAFLGVYGFGGRAYLDGQSFVRIGETQFGPEFTLVDDPEDPEAVTFGFDDDGTPKRRLSLVEAGVSKSVVHDRRTAAEAGTTSTGHAYAGSWFGSVPTNLVVGAGQDSPEKLIAGVKRGLFVSTFNYCRILDPRTQVVTGLTRNGTFLIEDGEITTPVTNMRFTQSFVDALGPGRILGIGDDRRYADSEFGPGMVRAPSMRLAAWHFTGGAAG